MKGDPMFRRPTSSCVASLTLLGLLGSVLVVWDARADSAPITDSELVSRHLRGGLQDPIVSDEISEDTEDGVIEIAGANQCYKTDLNNEIDCPARIKPLLRCDEKSCTADNLTCSTEFDPTPTGFDPDFNQTPYVPSKCLEGEPVGGTTCLKSKHLCDQHLTRKTGAGSCQMTNNGYGCKQTEKISDKIRVDKYVEGTVFCDLVGF